MAGGGSVKNDSNSMIQYFKVSTMREVNGYAIIKYNASEISEQGSENITLEENETDPMNNITEEPLVIMSVGEIEVQQTSDKTEVYSGDKVTYTITIRNRGEVELTDITMVAKPDKGMNLLTAEPQLPVTDGEGKLHWPNLGTLGTNGSTKLNYTVEINGSLEDATWLNNNVNVSGKAGDNSVKNDSNSMILYLKASTMREVNGYAIIKYKAPEIVERKPLVRNSTHLGRPLIWDRHAYGGWMEPREGDRYFIFDSSQIPKKRSGVWYTNGINATT
jgi:uncharacterized repeat protein (TIGR01451 family)